MSGQSELQVVPILDQSWGGGEQDVLRKVRADELGAFIAGYSRGNPTSGGSDGWALRVENSGKLLWQTRLPWLSEDLLTGIDLTADGTVYVAGTSDWFSTTLFNKYAVRGLAAALNSNGEISWNRSFELNYAPVRFNDVRATAGGRAIIGGNAEGGTNIIRQFSGYGGNDYWLLALDPSGEPQWNQTFGGAGYDYLLSVAEASDGYYLGGISDSAPSGNKTAAHLGGKDFWLVKTDQNGAMLWDRAYGSAVDDELNALTLLSNGNVLLGGTTTDQGGVDTLLIEVAPNGEIVRQARFGGTGSDTITALEATFDGGILLGGFSDSPPGPNKTSAHFGGADYWVVKLNASLAREWEWSGGGSADDFLLGVSEGAPGRFWLVGHSRSAPSGSKRSLAHGGDDGWIVHLATRSAPAGSPIIKINGAVSLANQHVVSGSARVDLSSSLAGAQIVYTLDGTAPHWRSPRYSGPFALDSSAVLRAAAMGAEGSVIQSEAVSVQVALEVQLAAESVGHGEVALAPTGPYRSNDVVTVTALPAPGWHFGGWSDDPTLANSRAVQLAGDRTLTAHFVKLEVLAGPGGSALVNPTNRPWRVGEPVSLQAVPANHFAFASWSDGNTSPSRSITLRAGLNSFTARFTNTTSIAELYDREPLRRLHYSPRFRVPINPTTDGGFLLNESFSGGIFAGFPFSQLRKFDVNGAEEWSKKYPPLIAIKEVHDGGFVAWGFNKLRRLTSAGEQIAETRIAPDEHILVLDELVNGDFIAASVAYPTNTVIYRFSSDLNLRSRIVPSVPHTPSPVNLVGDESGGYLAFFRPNSPQNSSEVDLRGLHIDHNDAVRWNEAWHSGVSTGPALARKAPDGWIIGSTAGPNSESRSAPAYGARDIWLRKLNDRGERIKEMSFGGSGDDDLAGFLTGSSGELFVLASSDSGPGAGKTTPRAATGRGDWILKVTPELMLDWELTLPSSGAVALAPDGTIQHVGKSRREYSPFTFTYREWLEITRVSAAGGVISSSRTSAPEGPFSVEAVRPAQSGELVAILRISDGDFLYEIDKLSPSVTPEDFGAPRVTSRIYRSVFGTGVAENWFSSSFLNGSFNYTLDGSAPSAGSPASGGLLILGTNALLRVRAFNHDRSVWADGEPVLIELPRALTLALEQRQGGTAQAYVPFFGGHSPTYASNSPVVAQATPSTGNIFLQWVGDYLSTNASAEFNLTRDTSFAPLFGTKVGTEISGNGRLVFETPGVYQPYGEIRVNAIPAPGHYLAGWSDSAEASQNPGTFMITAPNPTVAAAFASLPEGKVSLAVPTFGPGQVLVLPLKQYYDRGDTVTLQARSKPGAIFTGYSGDATSRERELVLTLTDSKVVVAAFSGNTERGFSLQIPQSLESLGPMFSADLAAWHPLSVTTNALGVLQTQHFSTMTNRSGFFRW